MILSAHFLAGAVIAVKTQNPLLGIILALLSHYLLDLLPSKEYEIPAIYGRRWKKSFSDFFKVLLDIVFGVLLVSIFLRGSLIGLLGGFFAIIPDGLTFLVILLPKNKILSWHYQAHKNFNYFKNKKIPSLLGIVAEASIYLTAIAFLK